MEYNKVCMYQYTIQEKLPTYTLLFQPKPIFQLTESVIIIDLVTVLEAILTSRKPHAWEITVFLWQSNVE